MKAALLLIDLQNDYLAASGLEPSAGIVVENAHRVLDVARRASIAVVHVYTTVNAANDSNDTRMPHWKNANKWSCVTGTHGHETPIPLRALPDETLVHKRFFSAFESGALDEMLTTHHIDTVILAGVHEHACVRATALDAYARGLRVLVARDAVGSDDALHAAITRRYLEERAMRYLSTEELSALLATSPFAKEESSPRLAAGFVNGANFDDFALPDTTHFSPRQSDNALWRVPICDAPHIARATQSARRAQRVWGDVSPKSRVDVLQRFATLLNDESETFAQQMAREIGKPILQGRSEMARAQALVESVIGFVDEPLERRCTRDSVARFRALGTVAAITPWNNPVAIPIGKIAPALFYGNAVVWKPSPPASAIALRMGELLQRAGCPDGLVNIVCGDHTTARALMSDDVDAVTLTGSNAAGTVAQAICARRHLRLQAELGGNNAAIVWHDCDLENAARQIAMAAFGFAGQRCTANRRAIIEYSIYDEFLSHLQTATRALVWGDPCDADTHIGPLISRAAQLTSSTRIERARAAAMQVVTPHRDQANYDELMERGAYFPPTIVCCDDATAEIVQHESFAPILVVQRATTWDEAMRLCNGVRQGLVAALFSDSDERREQFLIEAQAGILKINSATADANAHAPFGGWKTSGLGAPEHGFANREFYTRVQTVYG